jgi:hypothetical protein
MLTPATRAEARTIRARRSRGRRFALLAVLLLLVTGIGWGVVESRPGSRDDLAIRDVAGPASAPVTSASAGPGSTTGPTPTPGTTEARRSSASSPRGGVVTAKHTAKAVPPLPFLLGQQVTDPLHDVRHDQGNSVALPDGRSLWVFADTTQTTQAPYFFVTSSAAVSKRGSTALTWSTGPKRTPVEFLPRTAAEKAGQINGVSYTAVWPTGATKLPDGRIVIGYAKYLVKLQPTATYTFVSAGLYSYRYGGVSSLRRGVQATRMADGIFTPGDGVIGSPVYSGGYVYFAQCADLECYSLRAPVSGLTSRTSYQWFTGSGWSPSRAARKAMAYGASRPGLTPSMAYLPALGVYATTGTAAGHTSGTGLIWVSKTPYGPWSKPLSFALPNCPVAGCYTLNLHPMESTSGRIRISYATAGVGPYVKVTDVKVAIKGRSITAR